MSLPEYKYIKSYYTFNLLILLSMVEGCHACHLMDKLNHHDNGDCFTATVREWLRRSDLRPFRNSLARALIFDISIIILSIHTTKIFIMFIVVQIVGSSSLYIS